MYGLPGTSPQAPPEERAAPVCPKPAGAVSSARASLIISHQKAPLYPQAGFRIYKRSPAIGRTVTIMWREWCFSFETGNCRDPVWYWASPGRYISSPAAYSLEARLGVPRRKLDAYGRRYLASGFRGRLRSARLDLGQAKARHQEVPWILSGRRRQMPAGRRGSSDCLKAAHSFGQPWRPYRVCLFNRFNLALVDRQRPGS